MKLTKTQKQIKKITKDICKLLIAKNKSYGNSAISPVRIFSKASSSEQILVRLDDKLSRIAKGCDFEDEDVINDLIGYLVLLKISNK